MWVIDIHLWDYGYSNKRDMMSLDRSPELRLGMNVMASVEWEVPIKDFSCVSSGSHFVQQTKTILAILVEGHSRNISMKLFWKTLPLRMYTRCL